MAPFAVVEQIVDEACEPVRRRHQVVKVIFDFSKIEQGKIELDVTCFDVCAIGQEVVAILGSLAEERGNRLEIVCGDGVGTMRSDAPKLHQILFNLLSNAVKVTRRGEISKLFGSRGSAMNPQIGFRWFVCGS